MEAWKLGSTIEGKYRLCELLARGGQGEVYSAEHLHTGERVALKCMAASVAGQPELVERMLHEARVTAALRHPNHVAIRDCNVIEGRVYIVMELLQGRDCRAVLADDGPMSIGRAIYVVAEAAAGVAAAHEKSVVHRDLKPENIFVCTDNSVKVIDYGTSRSQSGGRWITQDGLIAGTLAYMPPERLAGAVGDERVDMFALGMILIELVLGRHPFAKGPLSWPSEAKLRKLMRQWDPELLTDIREKVSSDVWELFAKATAREPDGRFVDITEFRDCLRVAMEKAALAALLPSGETPVRGVATLPRGASEKAFAARVLEQTPILRPAVQVKLADTPIVTPIRYTALQHERAHAARIKSGFTTSVPTSSGDRVRDTDELPTASLGRTAQVAMGVVGLAAAFALIRATSELTRPAAAARGPRVSVQAATSDEPRLSRWMATTQAAIATDWRADVQLQNIVAASIDRSDPLAFVRGSRAIVGRSPGKSAARKRERMPIDLAQVSSGLDEASPSRGLSGLDEVRGKAPRNSHAELVGSMDDSMLEPRVKTKSGTREIAARKDNPPSAADLLIRSITTSSGE